jgi:hypothetical protein
MQFKSLFDVLKDLLTEVNIRFDSEGFKIVSLDPGKDILSGAVLSALVGGSPTRRVGPDPTASFGAAEGCMLWRLRGRCAAADGSPTSTA